jgi:hypothetical protein
MARVPRQNPEIQDNAAADEMMEAMNLERLYRADLLKELSQSYQRELDRTAEAILLDGSLYHWWWKFMQAHHDYPSRHRDPEQDQSVADAEDLFGNRQLDFLTWWILTGRSLFQEQAGLPLIKVLDLDRNFGAGEFPKTITLEVPLTVPRDGIVHQLDKILSVCHAGPKLERHAASTAKVTLHPKPRYRLDKMTILLDIWRRVQSEIEWLDRPNEQWWEIARDVHLNATIPTSDYAGLTRDTKRDLGKSARRLYDQADSIMAHAVRGQFPHD